MGTFSIKNCPCLHPQSPKTKLLDTHIGFQHIYSLTIASVLPCPRIPTLNFSPRVRGLDLPYGSSLDPYDHRLECWSEGNNGISPSPTLLQRPTYGPKKGKLVQNEKEMENDDDDDGSQNHLFGDGEDDEDDVGDLNFSNWVDWEDEILRETLPLKRFVKAILHSDKYKSGERLTPEDEKIICEKFIPYHPESEEKVGCGVDFIMVDCHPDFGYSRCLFITRKDGETIDFSFWKCLRGLVRKKYPLFAETFISKHLTPRRS